MRKKGGKKKEEEPAFDKRLTERDKAVATAKSGVGLSEVNEAKGVLIKQGNDLGNAIHTAAKDHNTDQKALISSVGEMALVSAALKEAGVDIDISST